MGVDFLSLFHVKRDHGTEKVQGCIFICLTCRAIPIEDVGSLESDAFIQALQHFISIHGAVRDVEWQWCQFHQWWKGNWRCHPRPGPQHHLEIPAWERCRMVLPAICEVASPSPQNIICPECGGSSSEVFTVPWRSSWVTLTPLLPGRPSEPSLLRQPEFSTVGLYAQAAMTPITGIVLLPVISSNSDKVFTARRFPRREPVFFSQTTSGPKGCVNTYFRCYRECTLWSLVASTSYKGVFWQRWFGLHSWGRGQEEEFNTVAFNLKVVSSGGVKLAMNVLEWLCAVWILSC